MPKERILIAVKTYPVLSSSYIELSCTAGFREDGSWVRIYPIPYRLLDGDKQFSKYQWIELDISPNSKDPRPESYRPNNIDEINLQEKIGTDDAWRERRNLILKQNIIYTSMDFLIKESKETNLSLAIFKPTEILDFIAKPAEKSDWDPHKIKAAEDVLKQETLFDDQNKEDHQLPKKLPYKFSYKFRDDTGKDRTLMIEDWEIGALYWNCLRKDDESVAVQKVCDKYLDDFAKTKDLYLFLGTTREWHGRAPNPFIIIGTFHPQPVIQGNLF